MHCHLCLIFLQIGLNVFQRVSGEDKPLMALKLEGLGTQIKKRPWDMMIEASLGSVSVEHKQYKGKYTWV